MRSSWRRVLVAFLIIMAVAVTSYYLGVKGRPSAIARLNPPYQMVLMANGQVYIGKLEGLGSAFPVLTDVFYFQTQVDPQTKESKAVLVKRGKEWHAPDRTILNGQQISVIEPVTADSALAKRLAELQK